MEERRVAEFQEGGEVGGRGHPGPAPATIGSMRIPFLRRGEPGPHHPLTASKDIRAHTLHPESFQYGVAFKDIKGTLGGEFGASASCSEQ